MTSLNDHLPFVVSSLVLFFYPLFSKASNTLLQGQTLEDSADQTLISPGKVFELGFFSLTAGRNHRYLGIYYHNISPQSIVWIANRDTPLSDSSGTLRLGTDGNLSLVDTTTGNSIWSTNSSATSSNSSASLTLEDDGRIILQLTNGTVNWDSFDHPTDTFLPGMKVLLDIRTGRRTLFRSWRSADDPSAGNYSLGLDASGQIFIWEGNRTRWRSGQWDGTKFIGSTMRPLYLYGFHPTNDVENGLLYFTYAQMNSSLLRFVLQWNGVENTTMLVEETRQWESVGVQPGNDCEIYGKCGEFGICSASTAPICSCLKRFVPKNADEWGIGNWSGGCERRTRLRCDVNGGIGGGGEDGFFKVPGVKVPDLSDWASLVRSPHDCESYCLNNCSCKAYAYVAGIGCLTWAHGLVDVYEFPEDDNSNGNDLYLKLAKSELGSGSKIWKVIVTVCTLVVFLAVAIIFVSWKYLANIKDLWNFLRKRGQVFFGAFPAKKMVVMESSVPSGIVEEELEASSAELSLYSFDCIASATNGFSDSNKLGEGGFGHVYKGMMAEGHEIAVKRLSRSSGQGQQEFKNEMALIAKLQHRNLVRLLGCCIEGEEKILIYEYMHNKSLDAFIFDPDRQGLLDWSKRFDIIEGIARGLLYLHQDSRLRIIHRDLKASNILLDDRLNPKISDFGMAKIFANDQNQGNTERVVGTFGYMAPEYGMEGVFSVKSDVYSFGILVLEIISGRRNNSFRGMGNLTNIVGYAWHLWNEDRAIELIDSTIRASCSVRQVQRCIHIALLCVQDRANDRPDMSLVLLMLASLTSNLPMPKRPTFTSQASHEETNTNVNESYSANDMTITWLSGR